VAILKPALACAALAALLTGCGTANPVGQPTYSCTPADGGTAYPCYQVQYDQKVKEDQLYAEAEAVYRKFLAEDERINRIGGVSEPTPVLLETTTGDYLKSAMANYQALKAAKATAVGGEFKVVWFKRVLHDARGASVATLTACFDTSSVQMGSKGKASQAGRITERTGYFVRDGETLKVASGRFKWVTQC
jgi:hypothetical protein